jgi:hypothetical protein
MNWKKVFLWSLVLVMALVIMMIVLSVENTQEYNQFKDGFSSLPSGQTIFLSDGVEMRREAVFVWVTQKPGLPQQRLVFPNTCTKIPYKLTSVHDNSVAETVVIVCNIMGDMYYRVPITS